MRNNKIFNNKTRRCIVTNKLINNNEVIIKDYALDYVIKNYDITEINNIYEDSRK